MRTGAGEKCGVRVNVRNLNGGKSSKERSW